MGCRRSLALFLTLNLAFLSIVSSGTVPRKLYRYKTMQPGAVNPNPTPQATCPRDMLKIQACADVLGGLINVKVGSSNSRASKTAPCCELIHGVVDAEAAACLCTAIDVKALGVKINVPVSLNLLLDACGRKNAVNQFKCA